ncbi:hypothetical protein HYC85_003286 [Camellia sinensis]|uniref:Peptidylprolyl isomerase n=1 Tax=Camellia sinensis TaxID=4442 RepID=A0A7J7IBX7_CAMSI|nr:hypothetical protein HYC85_003286 [Camellia sinensis]
MKKGEIALVTIHPDYAFGSSASHHANSTVYYVIEMVSFVKEKESWEMSTQEKVEAAGKKKEEGNALFKAGKYERASNRYEKLLFCEIDIKKALEIDPNNRDVKLEYKILKQKVKEYNKKDAQFYGNMFAKMKQIKTTNAAAKQEAVPMTIDSKA